jgi:hypothetical protein
MNIFVVLLMAIFMAGYYFMGAPNVSLENESGSVAMENAELKSVLECVMREHSQAVIADEKTDIKENTIFKTTLPCSDRYNIKTQKLCSDDRKIVKNCVPDKPGKIISNYIITTTDAVTENGAGKILELIQKEYPYNANIGIAAITDDGTVLILSASSGKREIAKFIAKESAITDGQMIYITQYSTSGKNNPVISNQIKKLQCSAGQIPVFRQNRWDCAASNVVPICSGDFIWDSEKSSCIPDDTKRPLCSAEQTAVMIDNIWECIDPEQKRECPRNYTAKFDYSEMAWVCIKDQDTGAATTKKCDKVYSHVYGGGTTVLRGKLISCNDCEKMIVHDDCTAECVPDASATANPQCYSGNCENFYFGFPDINYINDAKTNIPALANITITLDQNRSKNRKFNCIECPAGIDTVASLPPYVIICK